MEGAWGKGGSPSGAAALGAALSDSSKNSQHNRLLFAMLNLIGLDVTVHAKNGAVYDGILHACRPDNTFGVVLRHATQVNPPTGETHKDGVMPKYDVLAVYHEDFAMLTAKNADLGYAEAASDTFQTDAEISGADFRERELQRWEPSESDGLGGLEDDQALLHHEPFDQFAGKDSTFDEALYTTELDKSEFDRAEHERAARIADQIMKGQSANVHIAEERGQVTEKDYDEEERYGAVIRNGADNPTKPDNPNRYIPPSQRNAQQQEAYMAAKAQRSGSPAAAGKPADGPEAQAPTSASQPAKMSFAQMMKSGPKQPEPAKPAAGGPAQKAVSPAPAPETNNKPVSALAGGVAAVKLADEGSEVKFDKAEAKPDKVEEEVANATAKTDLKPAEGETRAAVVAEDKPATDAAKEDEKPKSKLNPNAKAFTMNVNAKPFVPTFAPKPAQTGDMGAGVDGQSRGGKDGNDHMGGEFGGHGRGPRGPMMEAEMQGSPTFTNAAVPPMMPGQPMGFHPGAMMMPGPGQFPPGPMFMPQQNRVGPYAVFVPAASGRVFPMPGMPFDAGGMPMMGACLPMVQGKRMPPGAMYPGPGGGMPGGFPGGPFMMPDMEGEMMGPPPGPGRRGGPGPGDMQPRGPKSHGPGGSRGGGAAYSSPKNPQQSRGSKQTNQANSPHPPQSASPQPPQQQQ